MLIRVATTALGTLVTVGAFASSAMAQPPPSDFDKVTAPMPAEGRRGRAPAPRLPDRIQPALPHDDTAHKLGLVRQDDGGYLYLDPGRRFTARVEPDGRVQFADRWRRPDPDRPERGTCCGRPAEGVARGANPFAGAPVRGPLEWIVRRQGRDPAAAAKATLLEQTREFRVRLAVAWTLEIISARLAALEGELEAIWNADDVALEEKQRLLFTRWDECLERFDPPTREELPEDAIVRIDEARAEAATIARAQIEAFIRRHAGSDSPHAFSAAELRRLNARRVSVRTFAPYTTQETP